MNRTFDWNFIWRMNKRLASAFLMGLIGHLAWEKASSDWWQLWVLGGVFGLGAGALCIGAVVETVRFLIARRRLAGGGSEAVDPRADKMASARELRARGMIK